MEIVNLTLPATNKFATAYYNGTDEIQKYFHYQYQNPLHYKERLDELANRNFMRDELADHIADFMKPFPTSKNVQTSIEKLRQKESVVVIGGQQAGILTGPLYSIHKVISIIAFASQKEKELGVPVIPVFWIAGEDHDYAEVNHIYLQKGSKLEKWVYPNKVLDKRMVTDCLLNEEVCLSWIEEIIETYGETEHTKQLLAFSKKAVNHSHTFVDFFAYIIMELFKDHGLLLIDSGNRELRKLEKEILMTQVQNAVPITRAVEKQQSILAEDGYPKAIEITTNASNLFYYDEEHMERVLLEYDVSSNLFTGKNATISFTKEEMLTIAREHPERLSNNVVTRPLMQESLFPTLAFIAGPGEISYWAELKKAFEQWDMKMPPIIPRINITLLERDVESNLEELGLDLQEVLQHGISQKKRDFLETVKDEDVELLFADTKKQMLNQYEKIKQHMEVDYRGLLALLSKNESIVLEQISFMQGKIEEAGRLKHDVALSKYEQIENSLRPMDGPQERTWNIYYFLNQYGLDVVNKLTSLTYEFDGKHKVVKL